MAPTVTPPSPAASLGSGEFPVDGPVTFIPSPRRLESRKVLTRKPSKEVIHKPAFLKRAKSLPFRKSSPSTREAKCASDVTVDTIQSNPSLLSLTDNDEALEFPSSPRRKNPLEVLSERLIIRRPVKFERRVSSFMRSADLGLSETDMDHSFHSDEDEIHANFHHPSKDPPPGLDRDLNETWVALDDGAGLHSPIAPFAVQALAEMGLKTSMNQGMWTPDKRTDRLLRGDKGVGWRNCIWQGEGCLCIPAIGSPQEKEILVWTGSFTHKYHGYDLPAIRALGIVEMSPKALFDLLVDSERVREYNKMSVGRKDLLVLQEDMHLAGPFGHSVTKVMRSESRPPMLRKILRFVSLLHGQELEAGSGYLIVTRAVTQASDSGPVESHILSSEILLGVNVIRKIEGDDGRCLMINVNHLRSPMVPTMIAKKLGLTAAVNFIEDIRKLC